MENASKALIIAGAILLSILLISLGILVYNNAKGTISDANLDSEEAQAFNTRISQYCGSSKNATEMNGLIDAITASNGAQKNLASSEQHYITVEVNSSCANYTTKTGTIKVDANSTNIEYPSFVAGYSFTATYTTDASGYINKVTIK